MDENNKTEETGGQPPKEKPFKDLKFYVAYFTTIIISVVVSWLLSGGGFVSGGLTLYIPYSFVGICVWAIVKNKNRAVALGILLGSITPLVAIFIFIFILIGGCGLLLFMS